eukprot:1187977-Prorocentrum_minimum.AAC.2
MTCGIPGFRFLELRVAASFAGPPRGSASFAGPPGLGGLPGWLFSLAVGRRPLDVNFNLEISEKR